MSALDQFNEYMPSFEKPNPVYNVTSKVLGKDVAKIIDPIGGLVDSLFGDDDKPSWKPRRNKETGMWEWANPRKANPVPLSDVPGSKRNPSKAYRKMANNVRALTDLLPLYSKAISGQIIPQAQAQLAAAEATSPEYNNLMARLYKQYGPQLNQIGSDIARQNALNSAETDKLVLEGPGRDLVKQALEIAKIYDPEYFKTRETSSNRLNELLNSIDLTSGLSGSERAEIERSQAQEGGRRGTYNAPSNLDTISNAMQFGNAGFDRLQKNRSALSTAIANATAALPTFKSGVDVFQVATGKSSVPNSGENKFTGINNTAYDNAASLGAGLLGHTVSTQQQADQLALTEKLNQKDWADYMNQVTSSISDIGSIAGGAMAMCWIARKAFGENNPRWKQFRKWLLTKAPDKVRNFYLKYGQSIANKMTEEDCIKCRSIMNDILNKEGELEHV